MTRFRSFGLVALVAAGLMGSAWGIGDAQGAGNAKAAPAPTYTKPPSPSVKEAIRLTPEGLRLGMMVNDVVDFYSKVLDQDYVPIYKMTPIGPRMKEVDAALAEQKLAFPRSEVVFGNLPTGVDNTPLKNEYNYRNNESMMSITRQGVTRYFFFVNKRLWKIYDALPLKKDGDMGASYREAVGILTKRFAVAGRVLGEDPAHGRNTTEVDWSDANTHVRAVDRSDESIVGLIYQDRATGERMAAFKAGQKDTQGGIDPMIAAATKSGAPSDPNASAADAYTGKTHATPPALAPAPSESPPKKK
jgi:hypothetical protein